MVPSTIAQSLPGLRFPNALPAGMTAEKLLNRLPKFVIRQGEVIDIRGSIRDTLKVRPDLVLQSSRECFTTDPGSRWQNSVLCRGLASWAGVRANGELGN